MNRILEVFEKNTSATATNRGFLFQYIHTMNEWFNIYCYEDRESKILCEYEDDIYCEKGNSFYFKQVKCYKSELKFSSSKVNESIYNYFIIDIKYGEKDLNYFFITNKESTDEVINNWERYKANDFNGFEKNTIEVIKNNVYSKCLDRKNRKISLINKSKSLPEIDKVKSIDKIIKSYEEINYRIENYDWISFCKKINFQYENKDIKSFRDELIEKIKKIGSVVPADLIYARMLQVIAEKSCEDVISNRELNYIVLDSILNETKEQILSKLKDSKIDIIDIESVITTTITPFLKDIKHDTGTIVTQVSDLKKQVSNVESDIKEIVQQINNCNTDPEDNFYSAIFEEDFKEYFVETEFYKEALNRLQDKSVVILLGMPGAGKTYTSKRISLEYKEMGYSVFYSDEGNIGNIKKYIQNCKKEKILVVLNDFLGQFYMEMNISETSEFGQFISYIRSRTNIKLLINSRNIIYKEASNNTKFSNAIDSNWKIICQISADEFTYEEKAKILYNHLKRAYKNENLSKEQCLAVIENKKFMDIILSEKFNPRIIEYVTTGKKIMEILLQEYTAFINKTLDYPENIWKEEVEKLDKHDRVLINTLFSLTKTYISKDILKNCFNNRIKNDVDIKDTTINYFDSSLNRLSESIIKVTGVKGKEKIGVLNPSINAYLYESLFNNENEVEEIIKHALYFDQIERFESLKYAKNQIVELVNSNKYQKLNTISRPVFANIDSEFTPPRYMYVLKLLLLDEPDLQKKCFEKIDMQNFVIDIFINDEAGIEVNSRIYFANEFSNIFCKLFSKPGIFDYDFREIVVNESYLQIILNSVAMKDDFWEILNNIQKKYYLNTEDKFYKLESVRTAIVDRIEREVIEEKYDEVSKEIDSFIEDTMDEESEDEDSFSDYVFDEVSLQVFNIIKSSIIDKLTVYNIDFIGIDKFDIDSFINDEIDLYNLIESKCNKIFDNDSSNEHIERAQKTLNNIFSIFEVCFF